MSNQLPPPIFKSLELPQREVEKSPVPKYRVYSDYRNFVVVEAENAQVALAKSGIKEAYRIEADSALLKNIINSGLVDPKDRESLANVETSAKPVENNISTPVAAEAVTAPAEQPAPETPEQPVPADPAEPSAQATPEAALSADEVNKLLQNS